MKRELEFIRRLRKGERHVLAIARECNIPRSSAFVMYKNMTGALRDTVLLNSARFAQYHCFLLMEQPQDSHYINTLFELSEKLFLAECWCPNHETLQELIDTAKPVRVIPVIEELAREQFLS